MRHLSHMLLVVVLLSAVVILSGCAGKNIQNQGFSTPEPEPQFSVPDAVEQGKEVVKVAFGGKVLIVGKKVFSDKEAPEFTFLRTGESSALKDTFRAAGHGARDAARGTRGPLDALSAPLGLIAGALGQITNKFIVYYVKIHVNDQYFSFVPKFWQEKFLREDGAFYVPFCIANTAGQRLTGYRTCIQKPKVGQIASFVADEATGKILNLIFEDAKTLPE